MKITGNVWNTEKDVLIYEDFSVNDFFSSESIIYINHIRYIICQTLFRDRNKDGLTQAFDWILLGEEYKKFVLFCGIIEFDTKEEMDANFSEVTLLYGKDKIRASIMKAYLKKYDAIKFGNEVLGYKEITAIENETIIEMRSFELSTIDVEKFQWSNRNFCDNKYL